MKVTLKDIADRAKVSVSSVSRALNRPQSNTLVHDQTRKRILQIAREMGYQKVHRVVQNHEKFAEMKVGLVLHQVKNKYRDPYFSEIIYGIEKELIDQGLALDFTMEVEEILRSHPFSGLNQERLALICVGPLKTEFLSQLKKQVPLVLSVGGLPLEEIDCVTVDFRKAAKAAVQYLIEQGHKSIAFLGGSSKVGVAFDQEERFMGYQDALSASGIRFDPKWIHDGGFDLTTSYNAMMQMLQLDERPTALFTASDKMAHGAYKAIQENGLTIPDHISVVSFDDIEMSEFMSPGLTTVRVYREEMGRTAVKMLIQRMTGNFMLPMNSFLPTSLMIRGSCMKYNDELS